MLSQKKKIEVQRQLKEISDDVNKRWLSSIDIVDKSGALSEEMIQEGSWLLAKSIVDAFCKQRPYSALSASTRKEFNNLYHFL